MDKTTMAIIGIGVFELAYLGLDFAASRHALKRAKKMAVEQRAADITEAVEAAQKRCDIFKDLKAKEAKACESELRNWKAANEFDSRRNDILESVTDGVREFKEQFGYYDKVEELNDNFDAAIEAFKSSIDYDSTKDTLETAISEAKTQYESRKSFLDLASDDNSELAMKLRHSEEELMNAKVKDAKTKLEALEKQLKDETEKLTQKKTADIRALEEKVSKEKIRLDKKSDKELEKLNEELDKAKNDILRKVRKNRSTEEGLAVTEHENDIRLLSEQHKLDEKAAYDIFDKMPIDGRIGNYLKDKKVPKAVVVGVAAIPVGLAAFLLKQYVFFVIGIVKAM